jgi:hypothetical protein
MASLGELSMKHALIINVPYKRSVKCLDPGLQGIRLVTAHVKGACNQAKPCPAPSSQETGSGDPAAMEEACAKIYPTHLGCDTIHRDQQSTE